MPLCLCCAAATAMAAAQELDEAAFRRLYPDDFYARFFAEGVRPDGRPVSHARHTSIGIGELERASLSSCFFLLPAIAQAPSSALPFSSAAV